MAIRIRKIDSKYVALCAAESEAKEGDVYLDDGVHGALTKKFEADFKSMGLMRRPITDEEAEDVFVVHGNYTKVKRHYYYLMNLEQFKTAIKQL
jgi:hypothetical protein